MALRDDPIVVCVAQALWEFGENMQVDMSDREYMAMLVEMMALKVVDELEDSGWL